MSDLYLKGGSNQAVIVAPREHGAKLDLRDGVSSGAVLVAQREHVTVVDLISAFKCERAGVSYSSPIKR